jgi:hypothetical protein
VPLDGVELQSVNRDEMVNQNKPERLLPQTSVRIPRDGDQRSELMSITIPK